MSLPITVDPGQTYTEELRAFTRTFFAHFGASVEAAKVQPDLLNVKLPADLAAHFGKESLILRFHQSNVAGSELVAFGSRTFDRMIAYLDRYGALTVLRLPRHHAGGEELLRAIHPTNAGIAELKMAEEMQPLFAFNWHITYRADDKREELLTILLDADGRYVDKGGEDTGSSAFEALMADAESVSIERGDDGQLIAPKLPPMTRLRQYAEEARKYAIYHADLQCITHEADVLPRLHKTLSRLKTYYDQQIEEVYDSHDPDGEKRRSLEQDLDRKIEEEVENHRLRVRIELFSYALIEVPMASASITLSDGERSAQVRVARNLYDGSLQRPLCHACGQETSLIALDRNGHITCDDCLNQCQTCQQIFCATCGVAACPVCGASNCDECSTECWACGERACEEHVDRCPFCGDTICHACQTDCAACGRRLCRSHMRVDTVTVASVAEANGPLANGADAASQPELICPDCAVCCPGCQQYSAHLGTCDASGQRFCTNCLVTCVQCGRRVGTGFYARHPLTGEPHCNECTLTCNRCGAVTVEKAACSTCGTDCCRNCGLTCEACGGLFCADHAAAMLECGHVICTDHVAQCAIGHEAVCPVCRPPCAVCERPYCAEHIAVCTRCRREVCGECVRRSGLCDTCATHDRDGEFVTLLDEPCAADDRVEYLLPHYRWMRKRDARHTLYIGRNREMSAAIIVVEHGSDGDVVLLARRLGILDSKYRERWL